MKPEESCTGRVPHHALPPLLSQIVENLPMGLTVLDGSGSLVYENAAAAAHRRSETDAAIDAPAGPARVFEVQDRTLAIEGKAYKVVVSVDATDRAGWENDLVRRAYYDDLTNLPGRGLIARAINDAILQDTPQFGLAFIDVDNFKYINDYYGHAVGDQLLAKIVERLVKTMRDTDVLARVGGDEFVLFALPIASLRELLTYTERLSARLKEPFFIDGFEIFSSASIGLSLYPMHGRDYEGLRAKADSAMYRVKGIAKGTVGVFDPQTGRLAADRMKIEQRLRLAIRDRRLCCAFQPKYDFRSNTIVGTEVLLRWRDEHGVIHPPGEFIKFAVELGLMDEIAFMVLQSVTEKIEVIDAAFGAESTISLNIAAKQAGDLKFMYALVGKLAGTGFADRFILELTEEAFLSRGQFQSKVLPLLREIGTGVSIDDFGVGYSSLSAIAEITADELKVDRSLISEIHQKPRNQSILKVIETLGSALGMRVVVEGVETFEELAYLQGATRIACAQGFYFSRPLFLEDLAEPSAESDHGHLRALRDLGPGRTKKTNRA